MYRQQPRRILEHSYPDLGADEEWPAARAAEGWAREHPGEPTAVIVNGREVWPVALIDTHTKPTLGQT
jgi:hypothetical protein